MALRTVQDGRVRVQRPKESLGARSADRVGPKKHVHDSRLTRDRPGG